MPNLPFECYTPFKIDDDYVFVSDDGRQASRYRKFSLWFSAFQDGNYGRYDERVVSPVSKKEHLIMLLIRIDNPGCNSVLF